MITPTTEASTIGYLAGAFVDVLWEQLSDDELQQVKERNKEEAFEAGYRSKTEQRSVCHSHDFCDANMAMDEAFRRCFGREPDLEGNDDTALWNAAWEIATIGWLTA